MENIDKIFITNLPSFYKIELYNRISSQIKILVVYTGLDGDDRNTDFFHGNMCFKHIYLKGSLCEKIFRLLKVLYLYKYNELLVSGWDSIYTWIAVYNSVQKKNSVVVESTIKESVTNGIKGFLKRLFLKRITKAYVSGSPHSALMRVLGFKGKIIRTNGVGIFHYHSQPSFISRFKIEKFLFVGRLVEVKNLEYLITKFNNHPELQLIIIGFGKLEEKLKQIANSNIIFMGAIDNEKLTYYYQQADVFILPSYSEPWGVVVEEALNNGTPVMVSNHVGCSDDLVTENVGVIFSLEKDDFEEKLALIRDVNTYNYMRKQISMLDFDRIAHNQVNCYL